MLRVDWEDLDILEDYRNTYHGEVFTGIAYEMDPEGNLIAEDTFVNGILNGSSRSYFKNGKLKAEENLLHGGWHGLCRYWYENGQMQAEKTYDKGRLERERVWNEQGELIGDYEKDYRFGHRGGGDYYIEHENHPLKITYLEKYKGKRKQP